METSRKEIAVGAALIVLLALLTKAQDIFMPSMTQMAVLTATVVAFIGFAVLVWRERGGDEREALHRQVADRFAFLFGAVVLMIAIVVQGFMNMLDPWLPIVLGALIVGKIAGLMYSKNKY